MMKNVRAKGRLARVLSMLLTVALLFGTWGSPVMAGSKGLEKRKNPENPSHLCGKDMTQYSCVYFGSYPQDEVTGADLTVKIVSASYDGQGDAVVDGKRYRRITKKDIEVNFGNSDKWFGINEYRYFEWKPIKWRVLKNEGETLFLMADAGLDHVANDTSGRVWEYCQYRQWLNQNFYHAAFGREEQEAIVAWKVDNRYDYEEYTEDKIYIPSLEEVTDSAYGFCENMEMPSYTRRIKASDYAFVRGAANSMDANKADGCPWWLRIMERGESGVRENGKVERNCYEEFGCVPVLHLDVSADCWMPAGNQVSGDDVLSDPVHHCTKDVEDTAKYSYIYFGSYPQTEVKGEELTSAITEALYDGKGDAWIDGTKYRRISKNDVYDKESFGDERYRYFKWERMKWRVLQNDGKTLLVMADKRIDSAEHSTGWKNSAVRKWLNGEFLGMAFSGEEQAAILTEKILLGDYGTMGVDVSRDRVFALSPADVSNPEYGFCDDRNMISESRKVASSEYAYVRSNRYGQGWCLRGYGNGVGNGKVSSGFIDDIYMVVPALRLKLSSEYWYDMDDGTSGAGGNEGVVETPGDSGQDNPENPIHCCAMDTTEYSYVYFGSYPQGEVVEEALTPAITGASYDGEGDAVVDGKKYRRISKEDVYNQKLFGNSQYRYFMWEPIKWRVLKNDGEKLFLLADKGLDSQAYHNQDLAVTWENSAIRQWLNEDFCQMAFEDVQQQVIKEQHLFNENHASGTEGGGDTRDKVFLLSQEDVDNIEYGFCKDAGDYYSMVRKVQGSAYGNAIGGWNDSRFLETRYCSWWLRSPGRSENMAAQVDAVGKIGDKGVNNAYMACVPALCVDLSSNAWAAEEEGVEFPENPIHHCAKDKDETSLYDYIYFGSYPQGSVPDSDLTDEIIDADYDGNGDAWVDGTKYHRMEDYTDSYIYFKWERIKWKVLQNDGNTLYLAANKALDVKRYDTRSKGVTWENSSIRNWLNHQFCGLAFSAEEQAVIVEQEISNEEDSRFIETGGNTKTRDKIYLLSYSDVINPAYGFCSNYYHGSISRCIWPTQYADVSLDTEEQPCSWWLRTMDSTEEEAWFIDEDGDHSGPWMVDEEEAIVPVLRIQLSSDLWFNLDDGTSGAGGNGGVWIEGTGSKPGDPTEKDPTEKDPTEKDPTEKDPTEKDPTEKDPMEKDPTEKDPTEKDPTEKDPTEKEPPAKKDPETEKKTSGNLSAAKEYQKAYGDKPFQLAITQKDGNRKLTYSSSDKRIIEVDSKGRVSIKGTGAAVVTVTAQEDSRHKAETIKIMIKVNPAKATIKRLKVKGKKKLMVSWKKDNRATGYQIQYSTHKKFQKGVKLISVNKKKMVSKTISRLAKGKKYYVRIRAYKSVKVNGKYQKLYGKWSAAKKSKSIR